MPIVARTGIKRSADMMYYIKDGAVWCVPRKKAGVRAKSKKKKLATFAAPGSLDYGKAIYYLDKSGHVAAAPRPKRRKKSKK